MNNEERVYARESLIMNVTEDILVAMEDENISKVRLARLLNKSKSFVTQMLGGSRNMTLRSLSDIAFALDVEVSIKFTPKKKAVDYGTDSCQWENSTVVLLPSCYQIVSKAEPIAEDYPDWQKAEAA
ncbi:MAG: helix-turn-helix domain-containing protein [Methylobacter sp.]|uniref:helix-turn-helix domain-containing protein n=1 Tax=Methylobacter sp. TaxID=2051955 RepID=UPI00272F4404|nr:helix-turn-helix domain-containing protein [Methylobacter sp.]MDP1667193.1 helix-turn-helix domain-containing protein [Methylobacter sp.]